MARSGHVRSDNPGLAGRCGLALAPATLIGLATLRSEAYGRVLQRRSFLAAVGGLAIPSASAAKLLRLRSRALPPLLDDIERRTFDYFWDLGRADSGLVPDRWPTLSFWSIAAVGFGLNTYPIGVERGWISRSAARKRTLATLRFLHLTCSPETPPV